MLRKLSIVAVLLGMGTAAQASVLAAGSLCGGPTQSVAVRYIYNAGPGDAKITGLGIFREPNISLPIANNCGALPFVLASGSSCNIVASIVNNHAHNCRYVVVPNGTTVPNVRGGFEVRTANQTVLSNLELR